MTILNSRAKTDDALPNYGCAISIMIAETIPMNRRTCAVNVIAPPVGNVALANRTIAAFRNGCSAMAKTIVGIIVMNYQKIVQFAKRKPISSVRTTDAFQSNYYFYYFDSKNRRGTK